MPITSDDERFLRRAIELAASGRADGEAPFGSLLVGPDGSVLAEDRTTVLSEAKARQTALETEVRRLEQLDADHRDRMRGYLTQQLEIL